MFTPGDIHLPDGETLKVEKVVDGIYCFPDAYKNLKQDFFKESATPIHTDVAAPVAARAGTGPLRV